MTRLLVWLAPLALVACTSAPPTPESVTARDTLAACRQQANTTYAIQNRGQIYGMSDLSAPQSSIGLTHDPMRGLEDRYAQERMVQDCVRNTGTQTNRAAGLNSQGVTGAPAPPAAPGGGTLSP
jgi:hypothetical protein